MRKFASDSARPRPNARRALARDAYTEGIPPGDAPGPGGPPSCRTPSSRRRFSRRNFIRRHTSSGQREGSRGGVGENNAAGNFQKSTTAKWIPASYPTGQGAMWVTGRRRNPGNGAERERARTDEKAPAIRIK